MKLPWAICIQVQLFSAVPVMAQSWSHHMSLVDPSFMAEAGFGNDIAMLGDRLAVGVPGVNGGVVRVYLRNEGGLDQWGLWQTLESPLLPDSAFGQAVFMNGENLFIGSNRGSWQFQWDAFTQSFLFGNQLDTLRGGSIDGNDTLVAIGTAQPEFGIFDGIVKVFARNQGGPGQWGQVSMIADAMTHWLGSYSCFGYSISVDGMYLAVGDPCGVFIGGFDGYSSGFTTLYRWNDTLAEYQVEDVLEPEMGYGSRQFGECVDLKGDTLFAGWSKLNGPSSTTVQVHLRGDSGDWPVQGHLAPPLVWPPGIPMGAFGYSVLADGPDVFIGGDQPLVVYKEDADSASWDLVQVIDSMEAPIRSIGLARPFLVIGVPETGTGQGVVHIYKDLAVGFGEGTHMDRPQILAFPVPATEQLFLRWQSNESEQCSVVIADLFGRSVRTLTWDARTDLVVPRQGHESGTQIIAVRNNAGRIVFRQRIVWQ